MVTQNHDLPIAKTGCQSVAFVYVVGLAFECVIGDPIVKRHRIKNHWYQAVF